MTEKVHKAVVTAEQEVHVKGLKPKDFVVVKTWAPLCGLTWVPGTQMDKHDEKVTCGDCLAKGKSDD
jgi:hypothetical protein